MINLNGTMTVYRNGTVFLPLPRELWRAIDGGCGCDACAKRLEADPSYVPNWDTLAMPAAPDKGRKTGISWAVHAPEMHPAP